MIISHNTLVIEYNAPLYGKSLAQGLNTPLIATRLNRFADTECDIFLEQNFSEIANRNIILVAQLGGSAAAWPINDFLLSLCFLAKRIRAAGAASLNCILPYYPYARQDIMAEHGGISSTVILTELLNFAGVNEIVTVDLHNPTLLNQSNLSITNVLADTFWLENIQNFINFDTNKDYVLVAPDHGAIHRIERLAQQLGIESCFITKCRLDTNQATAISLTGSVKNRYALIVDDIIDTGRTAISAADLVLSKGATGASAFFTHAVLSSRSLAVMKSSPFEQIITTDTIHQSTLNYEKLRYTSIMHFFVNRIKKIIANKFYPTSGTQEMYEPHLR